MNPFTTIAISEHRFNAPFDERDVYHPVKLHEGTIDLHKFKSQAESRAYEKTDKLNRNHMPDAEKLFAYLSDREYRKGSKECIEGIRAEYTDQLRQCIRRDQSIGLVLSCMPVKVRHPLKSFSKTGSEIDIGDVGTVLRMYEIAFGLSRIHDIGAHVNILSDGARYRDVFEFDKNEHQKYQLNLQRAIDYLGLGRYVRLVDEETLYPSNFADINQRFLEEVQHSLASGDEETQSLAIRMQPSINASLKIDANVSIEDAAAACNVRISDAALSATRPSAMDVRESLSRRSQDTVARYIAVNRAVASCDIYSTLRSLRMTVHPKPGQMGMHLVNKPTEIFPYHGQGFLKHGDGSRPFLDDIRVGFAADILRQNIDDRYRGITLSPEKFPFSDGKHPFAIVSQ